MLPKLKLTDPANLPKSAAAREPSAISGPERVPSATEAEFTDPAATPRKDETVAGSRSAAEREPSLTCFVVMALRLICFPVIRLVAAAGPPSATNKAINAITVGRNLGLLRTPLISLYLSPDVTER